MIKKLLIANRDEIAVRILNTCKRMGIATVAVYSQADKDAMHVKLADEAVCVGPDSVLDSYMNMENLIEAARLTGCDAIHPGYGFLSENARFAQLVRQCGLLFVGPDTTVIQRMGNKLYAKETLSRLGIPTIPGSPETLKSVRETLEIADMIGYPVIVKAVSGGGGKGMRVAYDKQQLEIAYFEAKSDVGANFGDDAIYLERLLENTKHIEVQIVADQHQNIVHLGERDCSIQRNHRKLVEEAPCGMLSEEIRRKIIDDALKIAKHIGYDNVGTVEFLLDAELHPFFIEMNPRIQVEHTVSEMITGIDIVEQQINSACGLPLSIKQEDIVLKGHAIECRINAEDPSHAFLPSPGKIDKVVFPSGVDIRIDTALADGTFLSPSYDALIAKVITRGSMHLDAITAMHNALDELKISGIETNIPFHRFMLSRQTFIDGTYTTGFIDECIKHWETPADESTVIQDDVSESELSDTSTKEVDIIDSTDKHVCEDCQATIDDEPLKEHLFVCPYCGYHFRIGADQRIAQLVDEGSFCEIDADANSSKPDPFPGYDVKLADARLKTGRNEAVVCGMAKMDGMQVCIGVLDANFMMGTMGSVVGDKITRLIEYATTFALPLIIVSASGGARMQEGIVSLMQMAKTAAALSLFEQSKGFYISVLTHPTTGGVSASFAMLGDIHIAEPRAMIGFAGRRVIEKTINETLPKHFQTAEFLLEKGFLDRIVERKDLKRTIVELITMHRPVTYAQNAIELQSVQPLPSDREIAAWDRVVLARHAGRPKAVDLLPLLFDRFIPLHGDRCFGDDPALIAGIGYFDLTPVTVLAQGKGRDMDENIKANFGMMLPEGYRKAMRLAKQAAKFNRPIITIIDTPGAYPGKGAEERGQAAAIAECLKLFSTLRVPVIAIVLSEGGSGGALALSVADRIIMFENAFYSILSPEGFASILWKDETKARQAAEIIKLTSYDLQEKGIVDIIVEEPKLGIQTDIDEVIEQCKNALRQELSVLIQKDRDDLLHERYAKFRNIGKIDA